MLAAKEESKEDVVLSSQQTEVILPCFSFYNDIESLGVRDIQIKRDFKHKIVSPVTISSSSVPIDKLEKYEVNLKLCTLFKGVPYGPAYIEYTHPTEKTKSF